MSVAIEVRVRVLTFLIAAAAFAMLAGGASATIPGGIDDAIRSGDVPSVRSLVEKNPEILESKNEEGLTPLNLAAREGKTEVVKELLRLGADLTAGDFEESRPIHNAAVGGFVDTVDVLLAAGADVDARDRNEMTPLHFAASYRKTALAKHLLEKGADVNARNANGWAPLLYAVVTGNEALIDVLLEAGAEANARADGGFTPLHSAASHGNLDVVKKLLEGGADIHVRDDRGSTPLHWALNPNTYEVAKLLLERGADAALTDDGGRTPLHGVARRGSVNVAELLLEHGADIDAVDDEGLYPVAVASSGKKEMVEFLLERGAKLVPEGKDPKQAGGPLQFAVLGDRLDIAGLLLDRGVDVDARDPLGRTALGLALRHGSNGMVEFLLARGAAIDGKEPDLGRTPLHMAVAGGRLDLAKLLLDKGADPEAKDSLGKTPLECACEHGFGMIAEQVAKCRTAQEKTAKTPKKIKKPEVVRCAPILAGCAKKGDTCVFFLGHSGWAVKTPEHFLIFDYFVRPERPDPPGASLVNGRIVPEELKGQNVYVFASHEHGDHFHEAIFEWKKTLPEAKYILGHRPPSAPCEYTYLPPRTEKVIGDVRVTTIDSNDSGVGFLVELDGLVILHMGDHANRSDEPGPLRDEYRREIDFLASKGVEIDLAFFPVSGCGFGLPETVASGVRYAAEKLHPKRICPMHAGDMTNALRRFAELHGESLAGAEVIAAVDRGDRFHFRKGRGAN
jgi:ankyrin repeat protein/L-ascorbate metabolism protein UlaG (beta-lactamase superfamily)